MKIGIYIVIAIILLAFFLILPKKKKTRIFGVSLICAAILCELFIFNFHSFHLIFGNYEPITLNAASENVTVNGEGEKISVEINGLSRPVGTLYLKCDMSDDLKNQISGTPYVNVLVDAKDSTQQANYRSSVAEGRLIRDDEGSSYIVINLSGNATDIRLRMTAKADHRFSFDSVTLNKAIPVQCSPLRLLLIVGAISAIYALASFPSMLADYGKQKKRVLVISTVITVVLVFCAGALTSAYVYNNAETAFESFELTSGNQITQELVDAFEAGQVELLDKPSEELLNLDNPYDWSERSSKKISCKWDHLLFDGKYYSYYGIAPVILIFLPYHLLTGFYFPTTWAVLLFGALGIVFMTFAYLTFCDLFCKKIPVNMVLSGLVICQISSGVWYNFCSPLFYEIAQTSGFCFTCAGLWLILRSGVIGDGKIKPTSLALSSVCLSLAVLCRPTLALYCVVALIFIAFGLVKKINAERVASASRKTMKKSIACYLCAALIPFAVIGGIQMLYNYARFGNPLDFGIQYSLTINDFTRSQYHTDLAAIGFHNFLFAFPQVKTEFPFVFSNFSDMGLNGYYFIANRNAIGLFWRALPCLAYFAAIPAYKALQKKERLPAILLVASTCVLVPLIIIFSIWESGYGVRYCTDFAWQFILGALGIIFLLYARRANSQTKKLAQYFIIISLAVAVISNFALIYDYLSKTIYLESSYLSFERIFEFWR